MVNKGGSFTQVIEADTASELQAKILDLASIMGGKPTTTSPTKVAASSEVVPQPPKATKAAATKNKAPAAKPAAPVDEQPEVADDETPEVEEAGADEAAPVETSDDIFASDEEPAAPVAKPVAKKLEFADIDTAIRQVVNDKGGPVARDLLLTFKDKGGQPVRKVSAVLPADYPKFVAACKKALAA